MGHTLLGNAKKAEPNKRPECLEDYSGLGDATPEYWIDGRKTGRFEGATAEKAVPFLRCP